MDLTNLFRALLSMLLLNVAPAQIPEDPFELPDEIGGESHAFIDPDVIRKLTEKVKPSVVAVRQIDREGNQRGIGSGFVVDESGLIATNLHVIGEARPVEVEFDDGSVFPVVEIHSSDRRFDLAVLRIDPGERQLKALKLGDSDRLDQGQLIIGFGSPMGLKFSVVSGVVSAIRELDESFLSEDTPDFPMIQIAMPIELGNSGGPILNLDGDVVGVVTLRHMVKDNLGFAVKSNDLDLILKKPNPVKIDRWKSIGALNPKQWSIVMKGDWHENSGVIYAKTPGSGFGGRTLCLANEDPPEVPYEVSVNVKLDNESGAAGLVFASDGGDVHYGFYPSNGKIRLTRFNGPNVYTWKILADQEVDAYEPGKWNYLRVKVDGDTITGFVNGEQALQIKDSGLEGRKAGMCKFRKTDARFRGFRIGGDLSFGKLSPEQLSHYQSEIEQYVLKRDKSAALEVLVENDAATRKFLEKKAEEFELLAEEMRELKKVLHEKGVAADLVAAITPEDVDDIDLFEVALQLARIDDSEMNIDYYRRTFSGLVEDARTYINDSTKLKAVRELRDFLFKENGFHGSRQQDFHKHGNSYINHVLDYREGLPITLSVLFIEMAHRLELGNVFGVALPGRFLVGYQESEASELVLINVFENGREMTRRQAEVLARQFGQGTNDKTFQPSPPKDIAVRMLRNLIGIEIQQRQNPPGALSYLSLLLEVAPDEFEARFQRALVQAQIENFEGAKKDLDWLLENRPAGINYQRLERFRQALP